MQRQKKSTSNHALPWDLGKLYEEGQAFPLSQFDEGDIKAIFYEGLIYQGRPTRVFAYYAIPESSSREKVPGVVLVHGGGGTAFKEWVRIWADRGYAAIAMDLEGHLPTEKNPDGIWPGHEWSGPARQGEFADYELPLEDQWMYHAVADVMLANSFLRSFDKVDSDKIGVHGISWGGIVTSLVAGVDERFSFAIPVYGCGYLYEASNKYGQSFASMPPAYSEKIKHFWDPSSYFTRISIPMLWVNWSHDPHFPLHLFSKSFEASKGGLMSSNLSIHFGLRHSHSAGWKPQEIYTFADQITCGGMPLAQVINQEISENSVKVVYESAVPVVKAELRYAANTTNWFEMNWIIGEAHIDTSSNVIIALITEEMSAFFIQMTDERGCIVSSPLTVCPAK
ncbi:prolyl oligopeptidase family serine peptidase [Paenibacillus sp. SYP-B3998]|uniref:Prolyl oligopeptidase family serine peptidase n=1 Tax=Paenibacillus sp. SYP-B3998 TaxID=2678564 RepID=A0A6G3ZUM7_9BACL|nr:acetylxylan esterase [Paenibacillus sp. SYP-B3998]NEW05770.1 prolyl oligopeptidase family serine peptidase [Paenibacillus sp. SYP-B3998]